MPQVPHGSKTTLTWRDLILLALHCHSPRTKMGVRRCQDRLEGIKLVNDEIIIPIMSIVFRFDEFKLINLSVFFKWLFLSESCENPWKLHKKREAGFKKKENINYLQML